MIRKNGNFKEVQNIPLAPYPGKTDFKPADKYELEAARLAKLLWKQATQAQRDVDISELRHVIEKLLDPDGTLIETKEEYDARYKNINKIST